jgi:hypothetical protein
MILRYAYPYTLDSLSKAATVLAVPGIDFKATEEGVLITQGLSSMLIDVDGVATIVS